MQKLQIFKNDQFGEVRTVITENGEPRFCLADLCGIMGLQRRNVLPRLSQDGVYRIDLTDRLGRSQQVLFITEKNLYRVIMRSDKSEAVRFQDWICDEVLPAIRKTGRYVTPLEEQTCLSPEVLLNAAAKLGACRNTADAIITFGLYMTSLGPEQDISLPELAETYGMEYGAFCDLLESEALIERDGQSWVCPCEGTGGMWNELPFTRLYTVSVHGVEARTDRKWTAFGRAFVLYVLSKERGVSPADGCFAMYAALNPSAEQ